MHLNYVLLDVISFSDTVNLLGRTQPVASKYSCSVFSVTESGLTGRVPYLPSDSQSRTSILVYTLGILGNTLH